MEKRRGEIVKLTIDADVEHRLKADMVALKTIYPRLSYARLVGEILRQHYDDGASLWLHARLSK